MAQLVKNLPPVQETWAQSWVGKIPWRGKYSSIPAWRIPWTEEPSSLHSPWGHKDSDTTERLTSWDFPGGSDGRQSACDAGDEGSISESGRSPGEGSGYPLQYSCLENSVDRGAWWATVHGIAELDTTERLTLSLSFL